MSAGTDRVRTACITVLGSGFIRFAPGSWASLVSIVLFGVVWLALVAAGAPRMSVEGALVLGILLASIVCVAWGPWAVERLGRHSRRPKDPNEFVLDEFAGQWVSLLVLPIGLGASWWTLACVLGGQFFWFRLFDVVKPPPVRQIERLPAGWGILADDLLAGVYANTVGQLVWRFTPLATWLGVQLVS